MKKLLPYLTLVLVIGCAGGGQIGGGTTGVTGTTGTATTGTVTTGSGLNSLTLTPEESTIYSHTTTATGVVLTANVKGVTDPTLRYTWESLGFYDAGGSTVLAPPGNQGVLETLAGKPLPSGPIKDNQVLYMGTPASMVEWGQDSVRVTASTSTATSTWRGAVINVGTDWKTVPPPITSLAAGLTVSPSTVKPGGHLLVTLSFYPNIAGGGGTFDLNGIKPTSVTLDGKPATLPITFNRSPRDPGVTYNFDIVIPANAANSYPVEGNLETGPWARLLASNYGVYTAYFIHS